MRALRQKLDSSACRFLRDQRGSAMMLFAFFLMVGAGFAAIVIDGGYLYSLKSKLQTTADAVVLAAANQLPDADKVREVALDYSTKNMATSNHGTVLVAADVQTGTWDFRARSFTPGGTPVNAATPNTPPAGSRPPWRLRSSRWPRCR